MSHLSPHRQSHHTTTLLARGGASTKYMPSVSQGHKSHYFSNISTGS